MGPDDGMRSRTSTIAVLDCVQMDGYCRMLASAVQPSSLRHEHVAPPGSATDCAHMAGRLASRRLTGRPV
jgi:hypothetical protein